MEREEGLSKEAHSYCDLRDAKLAQNAEKMKSLKLSTHSSELKLTKTAHVGKPRKKRAVGLTIPESTRVLRSQSVIPSSDNEEDAENIPADELEEDEELRLDDQRNNTRNGRKCTRMHTVYDRPNKPPVPVSFNEKGQPDGDNASEFSNFIATLVKTHIPLGHEDWRLVDVEKKNALLQTLRKYYVVDDKLKDHVMGSAHKKWRDFKEDLKQKFFKPEETDEEIYALIRIKDNRVSEDDCEWLVRFWRSEQAEKQSEQGKKNRSEQKVLHKSGSKSHARVTAEMHKEKGYPPRRDEVFIRTHTSKKGTPLNAETAQVIKDINVAIEEHPELLEKSVQQGDILSHVLGKERNGYVRCVGLGPTAGTLGIQGAQKLKSTKIQMAKMEAEKARQDNELLMDHIDEVKEDTKAQIDSMMEEMAELRKMVSQSIAGNNNTVHTYEIQPEASVGEYSAAEQSLYDVNNIVEEDVVMQELREAQQQFEKKKAEATLLIRKKKEAAQRLNNEVDIQQKVRKELELQKKKEDELLHKKKGEDLVQKNKEQAMLKKKETELQKKEIELQKKK